jgi:hypothetical protein
MYNYSSTDSETSSSEEDDKATGLSSNQNRLLYLLDLHTKRAEDRDDSDLWIRKQALTVLIYEGIIKEVSLILNLHAYSRCGCGCHREPPKSAEYGLVSRHAQK